jgi:Uma2 family endonuclease
MEASTVSGVVQSRATLDDLYRTSGKAELIDGRIVTQMATGHWPARIGFRIAMSLDEHSGKVKRGVAYPDNVGFTVPELPSGRESFSPDASYYDGPLPANPMRFIKGAPTFAAEVRSENDYDSTTEADMAEKRADCFAAGTLVVWDVDPLAACVHVYRASDPAHPATYLRGQMAEAEPAVPGWTVAVDWILGLT